MKKGDIVNFELYAVPDYEGAIMWNKFVCPVCGNITDDYMGDAIDDCRVTEDEILECGHCGSEFKLVSDSWYYDTEVEIIKLKGL